MGPAPRAPAILDFSHFRLDVDRRQLYAEGRPVELGGRAFDLLLALIEVRGTAVSKQSLMSRVWSDRIVEENLLQVQISALRKALGADRYLIRTIPGRGYQFTGEVRAVSTGPDALDNSGVAAPLPAPSRPLTNLPEPVSDLIGRDAELDEVLELAAAHRLVTLTGVGGIGTTRLGLEAARRLLPRFAGGVWLAELAPLSASELVPATVATALGLELTAGAVSPERVAYALGSRQVMVVLDNCEHVIEAAANMAEAVLRADPAARVIATSREPLRVGGEYVYRVPPLSVPAEDIEGMEDLLSHGAVKLFVARVRAAQPHFLADRRVVAAIAGICRHLDGIPLAIELAAARAAALGVEALAARLDDRFTLLTGGRRTALPRHQTLRATLDWSYDLLPEPERLVLRRVAVFAGSFTLEAASAVASSGPVAASDVVDCIANLVVKSLVVADVGAAVAEYRLLETTRAYAIEKLTESGELEQAARRHGEYCRDLVERAEVEWETKPTTEWQATYRRRIDDLRAALSWAFSPGGDASIGVAVAAASLPLWIQLSLVDECRSHLERALSSSGLESSPNPGREMQLHAGLGLTLMQTQGPVAAGGAWTNALKLAEELGNFEYRLRALWGLSVYRLSNGEYQAALALAQRFCDLAVESAGPTDLLVGDRMIGVLLHYHGEQGEACRRIKRMLHHYVAPVKRSPLTRFQFDQRVSAYCILARVLWLQGFPDQAVGAAQSAIEDARAADHAVSLCNALAQAACPVALSTGNLAAAERFLQTLLEQSARYGLGGWNAWGRCLNGALLIRLGEVAEGLGLLRGALEELHEAGFPLHYTGFLGTLVQGLAVAGQVAEALLAIEEVFARSERTEERWYLPEMLRVRGELVLLDGAPNAELMAENDFRQGLDWAHRQDALSWELRSGTSLARLKRNQGRIQEAHDLLAPIYDRFTEGFETGDLVAAKALIEALR